LHLGALILPDMKTLPTLNELHLLSIRGVDVFSNQFKIDLLGEKPIKCDSKSRDDYTKELDLYSDKEYMFEDTLDEFVKQAGGLTTVKQEYRQTVFDLAKLNSNKKEDMPKRISEYVRLIHALGFNMK